MSSAITVVTFHFRGLHRLLCWALRYLGHPLQLFPILRLLVVAGDGCVRQCRGGAAARAGSIPAQPPPVVGGGLDAAATCLVEAGGGVRPQGSMAQPGTGATAGATAAAG